MIKEKINTMIYNFREKKDDRFGRVRIVDVEGKPWFSGTDAARVLGYFKPYKAVANHVVSFNREFFTKPKKSSWDMPLEGMTFINEWGLRQLVRECDLNSSAASRRWLIEKVLPWAKESASENPVDKEIEKKNNTKVDNNADTKADITDSFKNAQTFEFKKNQEYSEYCKQVKKRNKTVNVTTIAIDYGWTAIRLNAYLAKKGVQVKCNGVWILNPSYADRNYTVIDAVKFGKTKSGKVKSGKLKKSKLKKGKKQKQQKQQKVILCTHWTRAGQIFIYNLLKQDGILPLIEREGSLKPIPA